MNSNFRLVDRFRYDEPQARPERESVNSDFWWLHGKAFKKYSSNLVIDHVKFR